MQCSCGSEVGTFDVHCRVCGLFVNRGSDAEQLGLREEPSEPQSLIESVSWTPEGTGWKGAVQTAGRVTGAVAKGLASGVVEVAGAELGIDTPEGYAQQKRVERAFRNAQR